MEAALVNRSYEAPYSKFFLFFLFIEKISTLGPGGGEWPGGVVSVV